MVSIDERDLPITEANRFVFDVRDGGLIMMFFHDTPEDTKYVARIGVRLAHLHRFFVSVDNAKLQLPPGWKG